MSTIYVLIVISLIAGLENKAQISTYQLTSIIACESIAQRLNADSVNRFSVPKLNRGAIQIKAYCLQPWASHYGK